MRAPLRHTIKMLITFHCHTHTGYNARKFCWDGHLPSGERNCKMARIVLGLGTSHSPQLSLPAEHWLKRGEEDQRNPSLYRVPDGKHVTYEELLAEADPGIAQELTPEVCQKRHESNQQ